MKSIVEWMDGDGLGGRGTLFIYSFSNSLKSKYESKICMCCAQESGAAERTCKDR